MKKYCLVETTFKKTSEAKKMAKILLANKLIACAQISTVESLYSWKGKIINDKEFLLSVKTKTEFYKEIEKVIAQNHSYELPQISMMPISNGSKPYFSWLDSCFK